MIMAIVLGGGIYTRQDNRLFQNAQILEDSRSVDVDLNQDSSVERKKNYRWAFLMNMNKKDLNKIGPKKNPP